MPHDVGRFLAMREQRLIPALRAQIGSYTPDFMTPGTPPGAMPDIGAELHRVATTRAEVVGRQMCRLFETAQVPDGGAGAESRLAPVWPGLRARAEADIEQRAMACATAGLAQALGSLHPTVTYRSATLVLADRRQISTTTSKGVTLFPSSLAASWLLSVDPWDERGPYLIYPARPEPVETTRADGPHTARPREKSLADIIGPSRLSLLHDLETPRTTTELAHRHFMSTSTASYHLVRLHRAGFLTRTREAHRVYYRRTSQADRLFHSAAEPRDDVQDTGTTIAVVSA
ncbi:hypothetical protein AB0F13_00890 [Streptomyces sp. NPDC026206]|uniref:ArsR/SmtB family transcription factor n=1 Tax=Streptomyces sp. NPDC026206 TaxID=3157089 RepID=UPI00340C50A4